MKKFWKVVGVILLFVGIAYFGAEMEKREEYEILEESASNSQVTIKGPYSQYSDHVFFPLRGGGDCDSLAGDVLATVIFVDENGAYWTESEMASFRQELENGAPLLTTEASNYGILLNLSFQYLHGNTDEAFVRTDHAPWAKDVLSSVGFSDGENAISAIKNQHSVREAPIVFVKKENGRSFAAGRGSAKGLEYAILYNEAKSFCHELLHLYGAKDFYYPDEAKALANECFPASIMNDSSQNKVDPLTAYLIGWTNVLKPEAIRFLDETKDITASDLSSAKKEETQTGFTVVEDDKIYYVGYLLDVWYHGTGTFTWKEAGTVLKGTFENGKPIRGTMTWTDGARYEGEFLDWSLHGTGTFTWKEGTVLKGTFENGKPIRGTKTWTDGARYEGEFLDWNIHGYGTLTYPNGKVRTGRWEKGKFVA